MTAAEQESLDLYMALGLLLERLGLSSVRFSRRELRWGMSGSQVRCSWSKTTGGDLTVLIERIGNMGVEGACPAVPWPPDDPDGGVEPVTILEVFGTQRKGEA